MEVQCVALAEALGLTPVVKRVRVRRPWRWLPPPLVPGVLSRLEAAADPLGPPWPDVLIATGRQAAAPALAVRKASRRATFTIQIQTQPLVDPARFDVVIVPAHDRLRGPNVIVTLGSLNRVTPQRLATAAARFAARLDRLPRPRVAVMLGGNSKAYRMTGATMERLGAQLAALARREGAGLLVTPSRRTDPDALAIVRRALDGLPVEIWDGRGDNPYLAYLGIADFLVVTADSVNMLCEAATTGKPVFVAPLEGGSPKFARFHAALRARGITRPFEGRLETWTYAPLRDTEEAAAEVRPRLIAHVGRDWGEGASTAPTHTGA
ncbi:MAG: hypothetical protein D6826_12105 [Alphaproteobacteria bacterium]|nr:MAG: hypothetical protein D6826_12105 [Alphaproteobacteria bacterium]